MYLAGGLLGLALGVVVCLLSLSLGLAPGALGLTCNITKIVSRTQICQTSDHRQKCRTLGVSQSLLGLRVVLNDVVQDEASGNDCSCNQDLQDSSLLTKQGAKNSPQLLDAGGEK